MTMTVREKLQDKNIGITVAVSLIVAALVVGYFLWPSGTPMNSHRVFCTDDDGQSYFNGTVYDIPPFDHNGKAAFVAMVMNDGHQNFVGYLQRFKPDARKKLQDFLDAHKDTPEMVIGQFGQAVRAGDMEIKLPGGTNKWIPSWQLSSLRITSPSGATDGFTIVEP
jgi:hypothetical protein